MPRTKAAAAAVAALVLALGSPAVGAKVRKPPCPDGRFLVSGAALMAGDTIPVHQPIALLDHTAAIGEGCRPVACTIASTRQGTRVRAVWHGCLGLAGPVRLRARFDAGCTMLTGTLFMPRGRPRQRRFTAIRSSCGDGIVDPGSGEQCESDTQCGAGAGCDVQCRCTVTPTTTPTTTLVASTTTAPATVPTTTTETVFTTSTTSTSSSSTSTSSTTTTSLPPPQSVARQWDEEALSAIRRDTPRPPVHARNLFHLAIAMWDAWAVYDQTQTGGGYIWREHQPSADPEADRAEAISFAAYHVLSARYAHAVGASTSLASFDARMDALGYDKTNTSTDGNDPASVGNRVAAAVLTYGRSDGSNEALDYADPTYTPVNDVLVVKLPGVGSGLVDPNRWQPLALDFFIDQNGIPEPIKKQTFIGSQWGMVKPFAFDLTTNTPPVPPHIGGAGDEVYRAAFVDVARKSSTLTPDDGVYLDISPAVKGNNPLGTNDGTGWGTNPVTGLPYASNVVQRGDWARVLAEFWADGPDSETPPGHWNVIANGVSDALAGHKQIGGSAGPAVNDLEWDVKLYLALNGALHDAAVGCWGTKRIYDGVRPITAIRYMATLGQSSDSSLPSYDPRGLPLIPGLIELITAETTAPGQRHAALVGHEGELALYAWPGVPTDPTTEHSGVQWIRALTWVPYQKPTFVTPAFPGYTSGHSTYSRSGAEVLAAFTGSPFFPGGLGEFVAPPGWLKFEHGPTTTVVLQWASYFDAADDAGISRLYGGIHPYVDDFGGRMMGALIGQQAFALAQQYWAGTAPQVH